MMIKDFGARVESVWEGLRPMTKKMIVGALEAKRGTGSTSGSQKFSYDPQSDWELSRLLTVLDEQARDIASIESRERLDEMSQLAETCVSVLLTQSESAEIFIQLAERALGRRDYKQIDKLADVLGDRF